MRILEVAGDEAAKALLAGRVPQLQAIIFCVVAHILSEEVDANGWLGKDGGTLAVSSKRSLMYLSMMQVLPTHWLPRKMTLSLVLPDIVLAVGLLSLYTMLNLTLGLHSVLLSHTLFCMAFVSAVVRTRLGHSDPSLEEAAQDLGDTAVGTFFRITVPMLAPGIVAGALLSFTLSLDDFVIAFFTNGPTSQTLPQVIYSNVRFGIKPDINALASVLLLVSTVAVLFAQRLTSITESIKAR